jgi:hypothetical protein
MKDCIHPSDCFLYSLHITQVCDHEMVIGERQDSLLTGPGRTDRPATATMNFVVFRLAAQAPIYQITDQTVDTCDMNFEWVCCGHASFLVDG